MQLMNSTKSELADKAVLESLKFFQSKFPQKVLSICVTGSYANGYKDF